MNKKKTIAFLLDEKEIKENLKLLETINSLKSKEEFTILIVSKISEKDKIDYVIKIPKNAEIMENYLEIVSKYLNENTIVLPLVILKTEKINGLLNSCLWNLTLTTTPGILDFELAQKMIDLTLYGAIIPKKIFLNKELYKENLPIYNDYYFLNKAVKSEIEVIGIPKTLLSTNIDLFYSEYKNEEKIKYFNEAKKVD